MNDIIPINLGLVYSYLVKGEKKAILIDCGFPGQEKKIIRALAKHNIQPADISLIVVTHGDIDHYGSSGQLRKLLNAPVLIHKADSGIIKTGINRKIIASGPMNNVMKYMALLLTVLTKQRFTPFVPEVIMETNELLLEPYGINGYILHTPGETAGSISVVLPEGRIIVGDLISGVLPHSAVPSYSPFSIDYAEVKKSLQRVLTLNPDIIYTGHSKPIVVKNQLERLRRMAG